MKIAQKLGLLVGALLAAVLITIIVLSAQLASTSREYQDLIDGNIQQRETSRTMLVEFGRQVSAFQQILLTFAQLSPAQTSLYWAVVRATEQLRGKSTTKAGPLAFAAPSRSARPAGEIEADPAQTALADRLDALEKALSATILASTNPRNRPGGSVAT